MTPKFAPFIYHSRVNWDGSYISYPIEYHLSNLGKYFELTNNKSIERNEIINVCFKIPEFDYNKYSFLVGGILRISSPDNIEVSFYEDVFVTDLTDQIIPFNKHRGGFRNYESHATFYRNPTVTDYGTKLYSIAIQGSERVPIEWSFKSNTYYLFSFKRLKSINKKDVYFYSYLEFFERIVDEEKINKFLQQEK